MSEIPDPDTLADMVRACNRRVAEAYASLPWEHPVGAVRWVHIDEIDPNTYNPNSVAHQEMRLLFTSISEDGYTQPVVTMLDENTGRYTIVDGYHRYTVMLRYEAIREATGGYLPIVVIDKPVADRIASTVRHNRARGKHSVNGMGNLVFEMLQAGQTDADVCRKLGLEAEELLRLKHITGYSKLFADHEYTTPVLTKRQMEAKADYKKEHPDEHVPSDF